MRPPLPGSKACWYISVFMHDFTSCMHVPIKIRYVKVYSSRVGSRPKSQSPNYNVFQHEQQHQILRDVTVTSASSLCCKIEKEGAHFMTSGYVSKLEIERRGFQSCMKLHKNAVLDFRKSMLEEAKETSSKWSTKSLFRLDGVTAVWTNSEIKGCSKMHLKMKRCDIMKQQPAVKWEVCYSWWEMKSVGGSHGNDCLIKCHFFSAIELVDMMV